MIPEYSWVWFVIGEMKVGLPENVWRKKVFLQEIPAPYACLACSRYLGSIYIHTYRSI